MRIGIVIPYYENSKEAKDRLEYLIESVYKPKKCKIVVVDDGRSALWLDRYKKIDVLHIEHRGVSGARNVGIAHLIKKRCKYIGFVDADDSISRDYLKEAYKECKKNRYDMLDSRYVQSGIEVFGTFNEQEWQKSIVRNGVTGCFFKSKLLKENNFNENMHNGEDSDFARRKIDVSRHKKGLFNGIYVYNFGVNPNSIIKRCMRGERIDE